MSAIILDEEEQLLADTVRDFAKNRIAPKVREMEKAAKIDAELIREIFELGLMGIEIPSEYGGSASSFFTAALVVEELAKVDPSVAVFVDVQNTLVNNCLLRWANEEQKQRYLPKLSQKWVGSYALSEAASGSDAFALQCKAEKQGDEWCLNGEKLWITNAADADLFIVLANAAPELGYKGITAFLIEKDHPGFRVGKKEEKLGIIDSSTCPLILEDCHLADSQRMGEVGSGYKIAIETLNEGRIGIGAQMIGLAQGALDHALKHLEERKQFGKALMEFQGIQFQFAQLATELEAARLLVYQAAKLKDAGRPFVKEAAMAKLFSSQVAERVASKAVEFFGGVGFTKEFPVEKLYRDAKIGAIYEGTSNMQLMTIAKMLRQSAS